MGDNKRPSTRARNKPRSPSPSSPSEDDTDQPSMTATAAQPAQVVRRSARLSPPMERQAGEVAAEPSRVQPPPSMEREAAEVAQQLGRFTVEPVEPSGRVVMRSARLSPQAAGGVVVTQRGRFTVKTEVTQDVLSGDQLESPPVSPTSSSPSSSPSTSPQSPSQGAFNVRRRRSMRNEKTGDQGASTSAGAGTTASKKGKDSSKSNKK